MICNDKSGKLYTKSTTIKNSNTDFNGCFSSELLAPAGSKECFFAAINSGADAVYMGGNLFGARAYADNPTEDELLELIDYAHLHNKKLFLTVNTLLKNSEINEFLYDYIKPYYVHGLDAVIVQDFGVLEFFKEKFPDLPVHISTQMTVTNTHLAKLLREYPNVTRIVTARELSLDEIKNIYDATGLEIESFVHGALCYSYSGQCLFSSIAGNRSGNRGRCAQPCRLPYKTSDGTKYILSPKDLMTLEILPKILKSGVFSLKIEGRMKKPEYVASVVSTYRYYLDLLKNSGEEGYKVNKNHIEMLMDIYNRGNFTKGYYLSHNGSDMMSVDRPNHAGTNVLKKSKDGRYIALKDINKGDLIEIKGDTFNVGSDVKSGNTIDINKIVTSRINNKTKLPDVIIRTRNNSLIQQINENYINKKLKRPVTGYVEAVMGLPLKFTLVTDDISVCVTGDVVTEALNKPVTKDDVLEKFSKIGNTDFTYDKLNVNIEPNVFISMKLCNELRREAFEKLKECILAQYRREDNLPSSSNNLLDEPDKNYYNNQKKVCEFNVLISSEEQLLTVLAKKEYINRIYIDLNFYPFDKLDDGLKLCKKHYISAYFALPYIFRKDAEETIGRLSEIMKKADGYLIRTLEELSFLKENVLPNADNIVMDYSIYNYNSYSEKFLNKFNPEAKTLSIELDYHELKEHKVLNSELMVYGYFPIMLSAQCSNKTLNHCKAGNLPDNKVSYNIFYDRLNNSFRETSVCRYCYSILYNNKPISLLNVKDKVEQINPVFKRLNFVFEDAKETQKVLDDFIYIYINGCSLDTIDFNSNNYTKGHFTRKTD
ncbi:MAG: U32 family peptidase [Lachnospiraceae bacterium]|nr:U32 family peptidase [Lachnospiraceae bacterium]